jgi:hypothetical protein
MAEVWPMPSNHLLMNTGDEWLLQLLVTIPDEQRAPVLMTIWRIWHAHNEMTHNKPCPTIEGSRRFLVSYMNSLLMIKQYPNADVAKGKMVIDSTKGFKRMKETANMQGSKPTWLPPKPGEAKLNVDGAFTQDGAGTGMVLRDHQGHVIFAACRSITYCRDATEAELTAIEEGLRLALHWTSLNFTIETDCADAAELIKGSSPNMSVYAFKISVIHELLQERDVSIAKISRGINVVSHELAKLSRVSARTEFWLRDFPQKVAAAVAVDCNLAQS